MRKYIFIIILASTLGLNGCADTADAEDSTATTPVEQQTASDEETASGGATVWIAIVTTWMPINRTIDKEFASEVACWNYYENGGAGEGKFGTQHLDHQGNTPDKGFHFGPDHLEYPIRTYYGTGEGTVWLTCDIKGRYEGL